MTFHLKHSSSYPFGYFAKQIYENDITKVSITKVNNRTLSNRANYVFNYTSQLSSYYHTLKKYPWGGALQLKTKDQVRNLSSSPALTLTSNDPQQVYFFYFNFKAQFLICKTGIQIIALVNMYQQLPHTVKQNSRCCNNCMRLVLHFTKGETEADVMSSTVHNMAEPRLEAKHSHSRKAVPLHYYSSLTHFTTSQP